MVYKELLLGTKLFSICQQVFEPSSKYAKHRKTLAKDNKKMQNHERI